MENVEKLFLPYDNTDVNFFSQLEKKLSSLHFKYQLLYCWKRKLHCSIKKETKNNYSNLLKEF